MRLSWASLCALLACLPTPAGHGAESADERVRLLTAHVDLAVTYQPADEAHKLDIVVRDDDQGQTYRSNEVSLVVREAARLTLPAGTVFGNEGDPLWVLPQSPNPEVLFVGLSGEALLPGPFTGAVELRLVDLRGPGHVFLWQADAFGVFDLRMDTRDGVSAADAVQVPLGGHAHYNWGFTTNGVFEVVLQAFGQRAGVVTNDFSLPTALRFEVEPLPPDPDTPFRLWQRVHWPGVEDPAVIGPDADPDGDAVVNAVEYALGLDPKTPGHDGLPAPTVTGTPPRAALQFSTPAAATDVEFVCWRAFGLPAPSWERLPDPQVAPGLPGDVYRVLRFDGGPIDASRPLFLRLEINLR